MPEFHYKAATGSGDVVQGEMEAATLDAVMRTLQAQGYIPIRAEELTLTPGSDAPSPPWLHRDRAGRDDVDAFTRELAALLDAQMPVEKGLETLAGIADKAAFKQVLEDILSDVHRGATLAAALAPHGRLFSRFYRDMVEAGEANGALATALAKLAELSEHSRALRDSVFSTLLYPSALLAAALASMLVILGAVVPRISQMFAESGQSLPWFTQVVVAAGAFVQSFWWLLVLTMIAIMVFVYWQYARPASRLYWDRRLLRLPVTGALIAKFEAARFTRALGALLGGGVPLPNAVSVAGAVVTNRLVAEGVRFVAERVRRGEGLARPLTEVRVFPPLAGHLMQVGEERGNLEDMLMQLTQIYDNEVQSSMRRLTAVLEPALIVGLAVFVSAFTLSLIIPILSIN